jgi:hypothetical protein
MLAMGPPLLCPVTYTGLAALGRYPATSAWIGSMMEVVASKKPLWTRPGTRFGPLVHVVGSAKKSCNQSSRLSGPFVEAGSVPRKATTMPNGHWPTVAALISCEPPQAVCGGS